MEYQEPKSRRERSGKKNKKRKEVDRFEANCKRMQSLRAKKMRQDLDT